VPVCIIQLRIDPEQPAIGQIPSMLNAPVVWR
jgi:hypothetical protein